MHLSDMLRVFRSVSDDWRCSAADEILTRWQHDDRPNRILRASANCIVEFWSGGERHILRFTPAARRTQAEIHAEVELLLLLAQQNVPVNLPIVSVSGRWVESVTTTAGEFFAIVLHALPGNHVELEHQNTAMLTAWGRALAQLHCCTAGYTDPRRPSWQDHLHYIRTHLAQDDTVAWRALECTETALRRLPLDSSNSGLIHYDFEPDNLFWHGETLTGMIDFDDSARYPLAADLAYALRDLWDDCASKVNLADERLNAFVAGYRQLRGLPGLQLTWIPLLLRLLNLHKYVTLQQITAEPPAEDEPTWLDDIRQRLSAMCAKYLADFQREIDLPVQ